MALDSGCPQQGSPVLGVDPITGTRWFPWVLALALALALALVADPAWETWLEESVIREFCHCRMRELFDLVADYPDSHLAVMELGPALVKTQLHEEFKLIFVSVCCVLVRPGANTSQIIDVYINTINVLRYIDPSDRLLQQVAQPVGMYPRLCNSIVAFKRNSTYSI